LVEEKEADWKSKLSDFNKDWKDKLDSKYWAARSELKTKFDIEYDVRIDQ